MKSLITFLLLLVGVSAFARKPLYTGEVHIREIMTLTDVSRAIKKSLAGRGWTLLDSDTNEIKARLYLRSHMAEIRFEFDLEKITIHYVDSKNLSYREKKGRKKIHRNYNNWITNLEKDIKIHLIQ